MIDGGLAQDSIEMPLIEGNQEIEGDANDHGRAMIPADGLQDGEVVSIATRTEYLRTTGMAWRVWREWDSLPWRIARHCTRARPLNPH